VAAWVAGAAGGSGRLQRQPGGQGRRPRGVAATSSGRGPAAGVHWQAGAAPAVPAPGIVGVVVLEALAAERRLVQRRSSVWRNCTVAAAPGHQDGGFVAQRRGAAAGAAARDQHRGRGAAKAPWRRRPATGRAWCGR
jgi:hypothetical protein